MSKKLDQIIVIDIESTCWQGNPSPGEESEIIEIGICSFDVVTAEPLEKHSILVKPTLSKVSEFCTQLTTLTQQEVDSGVPFSEACSILKKQYLSNQRVWASYGDYDRKMFEKQCQYCGVKYPFGSRHVNVKTLFAVIQALSKEVSMSEALEILSLPLKGTHHRGVDDAGNIARILSKLLQQARIDNQD